MRYSRLLIPTVKEVPAEAEIASHRLMIRAGLIRKLASGTYTYLPLGWRSLRKIMDIVRQEMDAAGAQEISMPIVQPMELWRQTGRDAVFQEILGAFTDHHGRENVLAPTAEEVVTSLVAAEVSSYKQLPINLYQIHTKFRDEFRPQYGVIRSREFLMKDAYSFHATPESLDAEYRNMYDAYCRIFTRCGLEYVVVQAESGGMGGTDTEEFMVPMAVGDVLVTAEDGSYAANIEKAEVDPPAADADLDTRRRSVGPMEPVHTPNVGTIEAVCAFLATRPEQMIKTLIYAADGAPVAALVRGDHEMNENKLHRVLAAEQVELAGESMVHGATGAAVGFAGPMGLDAKVSRMIVDHAVAAMVAGVAGANRTDYHVKDVVPGRDFPIEGPNVVVADIRNAAEGDTFRGRKLRFSRGIEVGHVFKLGTKYSKTLGATVLDEQGRQVPCIMGCYGIGINRILAAAVEIGHDKDGCIFPVNIAPFEVEVIPLNNDVEAVVGEASRIYDELEAAGADVLLDDRDVRPGVKFKDADLIGLPLRVVVGERSLKEGNVEIKRRTDPKPTQVPAADAVREALKALQEMKSM
ncbi:MAG TPA: proline--tRNA ligase [Phycisphaerae bacterium]|nr:proline--tRNA ligase [Phycisphaerae bacterium]